MFATSFLLPSLWIVIVTSYIDKDNHFFTQHPGKYQISTDWMIPFNAKKKSAITVPDTVIDTR